MRKEKKIFFLALISFFLLSYVFVFGTQANASMTAVSDVIWVEENYSMAQEVADAASSGSIEVDQAVAKSFQGNVTGIIQGGQHQVLHFSSGSNSAWFSRHLMCKDHDHDYNPIEPTTIFRPSDIKAVCLTTISTNDTTASVHPIEFRWHYRSNTSKTWVSCLNVSGYFLLGGIYIEQRYQCNFSIAGYWPGYHYPRAYMVEVYLDGSPSFSEFFEVTNGGLNSPRMCEGFDANGHPVNMKSRFTIVDDKEAYHYLRFDKIAYFNENLGCCHNFTTVWIQPDGSTNKTYSGNFTDYKDINVTWNYWEYNYTQDDYISINPSTPVGNWKVEVYLDRYYFNNTWMPYGPIATTPFIVGNESVADWTFMVYLDADNNLEPAGIEIFLQMANVSSSSQVNIVAQMDRHPGYDDRYGNWTDCKRFNVTEGMTPTSGNSTEDLGEVNMGHPDTLKDFVNWTINNYPANYYFLVLWDHGTGFVGISYDFTTGPPIDFLTLPELSQALSGLPAIMDIVFLDACSMSMTEVAYQIKDYANVLVGPEGLGIAMVDSRAAPYDDYLSSLTNNSSMLPNDFAKEMVTDYIDWCNSEVAIQNATMSATDLTNITSLMAAIDDFALKLKEKETPYLSLLFASHEQIIQARNLTEGYIGPYADQTGYYIDLYNFTQLINQYVLDEELQNTADQVMTALENIIIIEANKARPDSHGLSIFFPDEKGKYDSYGSEYENTTFAEDTPWDEFVKYHLSGYILTIKTPYPDIQVKIDDESYTTDTDGKIRVFVLPDSYTVNVTTPLETGPSSRGVFTQWNDSDTSNPRTVPVDTTLTLEAEYETQYYVTIDQSGSDVTVTATIDESSDDLPVSFWWTESSSHNVSVPLTVSGGSDTRYKFTQWNDTETNPSRTITVTGPTTYTAYYRTQYAVTFSQSGIDTDFTGTVVTIDGTGYNNTNLHVSFWWDNDTTHTFAFQQSLVVTPYTKRYVWNSTSGLSSLQSDSITVSTSGNITGNYKTQYYLKMSTNFGTVNRVSGWLYASSTVQISASAPDVDDGERYVWLGWVGTGDGNYTGMDNPVTITMNSSITERASWQHQYRLIIDANFGTTNPSAGEHWYEADSTVEISATAPSVTSGEQYVWLGWTGTGTGSYSSMDNLASITMNDPINETATWRHQYLLTVRTDPIGISPQPTREPAGEAGLGGWWYDSGTLVNCTAQEISGRVFDHWTVDGARWDPGVNKIPVTMDGPCEATAHYVRALSWWEALFRPERLHVILGLVGIGFSVILVGTALVIIRRKRAIMKAPAEPVPIEVTEVLPDRVTTGSPALDNLLFGGIPENYAVILTSHSCDERDSLIKRFLETGAKKGEVTFYVTTDPGEAKSLVEEFQPNFYLFICNPQADKIIESLPNVFKIKGVENLTDLSIALSKAFRRIDESITGPKIACIEIISDVLLQHHAVQTRIWLTDIITELKSRGFTTLAVVNPKMHPPEEVHAILDLFEGEINIYERAREENFLKIKKMYKQRYLDSELPLKKEKLEKK